MRRAPRRGPAASPRARGATAHPPRPVAVGYTQPPRQKERARACAEHEARRPRARSGDRSACGRRRSALRADLLAFALGGARSAGAPAILRAPRASLGNSHVRWIQCARPERRRSGERQPPVDRVAAAAHTGTGSGGRRAAADDCPARERFRVPASPRPRLKQT